MASYAITDDEATVEFEVEGMVFLSNLREVAEHALDRGVTNIDDLYVVKAERVELAAPDIDEAVDNAMQEIADDHRSSFREEMADKVAEAQKLLDAAFSEITARGVWTATSREIDKAEVARALADEVARRQAGAPARDLRERVLHALRKALSYRVLDASWTEGQRYRSSLAFELLEKFSNEFEGRCDAPRYAVAGSPDSFERFDKACAEAWLAVAEWMAAADNHFIPGLRLALAAKASEAAQKSG